MRAERTIDKQISADTMSTELSGQFDPAFGCELAPVTRDLGPGIVGRHLEEGPQILRSPDRRPTHLVHRDDAFRRRQGQCRQLCVSAILD